MGEGGDGLHCHGHGPRRAAQSYVVDMVVKARRRFLEEEDGHIDGAMLRRAWLLGSTIVEREWM